VTIPNQRLIHGITQHSQETDSHTFGWIQTRNPSIREAADPRLRPRGHWNRVSVYSSQIRSLGTESALYARKELCVFNVMCAILTSGGLEVTDVFKHRRYRV